MKKLLSLVVFGAILTGCKTQSNQASNFIVNDAVSKAEWKGSAPDHFHIGSFKVTGVLATTANGVVKSGEFTIPIASIEDFDLPAEVKPTLLADLKDNFFKIAVNPNATFHIKSVKPYNAADTGAIKGANYLLAGDFAMVGQTHTISFPAKIVAKGDSLIAEAKFNLDRLKWGMNNYSDPNQKLYILPDVNIHLKIQAAAGEAAKPQTAVEMQSFKPTNVR